MTIEKHTPILTPYLNTIIEGDCRKIIKEMPSSSVHCIITSPPYFHSGWDTTRTFEEGMISTEEKPEDYINTLVDFFVEAARKLTPSGSLWVILNESPHSKNNGIAHRFVIAMINRGFHLIHEYIWSHDPGYAFDYVFWFSPNENPYINPTKPFGKDIWEFPDEYHEKIRFEMTNRLVICECMERSTRKGDIVLDPFAGSGQVCLVAATLKRQFIGIELVPEIREVALERLEDQNDTYVSNHHHSFKQNIEEVF